MGNFVEKMKTEYKAIDLENESSLKLTPIYTLKEYLANYQMICESFSINFSEFEQIFETLNDIFCQKEFRLWDTDNNGLIDSFELFTGIIIYGECSTIEKVKCLFELYDFNHIQTLAFYDLCYLFENCINCCFKMFKINIPINSSELQNYLSSYFFSNKRSNLDDIIHFLSEDNEVRNFLEFFKISPLSKKKLYEENMNKEVIQKIDYNEFKDIYLFINQFGDFLDYSKNKLKKYKNDNYDRIMNTSNQGFLFNSFKTSEIINSSRFQKFRKIAYNSTKRLIYYRTLKKPKIYNDKIINYNLKLNWVYGINIDGIKYPCKYLNGGNFSISTGQFYDYSDKEKANNSLLLYTIGKIVVILYVKLNKQKYYLGHQNEVISIAISKKNCQYIASGESGRRPCIHIWDSQTRQTKQILSGFHSQGIHLMEFGYNEIYLLTCGKLINSPVLLYDWVKGIILYSFKMNGVVQDIKMIYFDYSVKNIGGKNNNFNNIEYNNYNVNYNIKEEDIINSFILCTLKDINIIQINKGKITFYEINKNKNPDTENNNMNDSDSQKKEEKNTNKKYMVIIYPLKGDVNPLYIDDNKNMANNAEISNKKIIIMSNNYKGVNFSLIIGYSNGELEVLDIGTNNKNNIDKLPSSIVSIVSHTNVLIVGTAINGIHIYDKNTFKKQYDLQLIDLDLKLIGLTLCSLDISLSKLLLITFEGDLIELKVDETGYINKETSERINSIIKLAGNINNFTIIKEVDNNLIFGGDNGVLSYININTNEPSDYFNFGKKITCIDSICLKETGFLTAIGFDSGDVIIRENWDNEINEKNKLEKFTNKMITDVKFGEDETFLVVCSLDKNIVFYELIDNKYKKLLPPIETQEGYPLSLCFDGDFQKLLIVTSNWKFTIIDIEKKTYTGIGDDDLNSSYWINFTCRCAISPKSLSILSNNLLIGVKHNFVVASDERNNIHFWKNPTDIEKNSGQVIRVHGGHVQTMKITLEDEFLITSGLNDHMICKWEIKPIYNDIDNIVDKGFYNNLNNTNLTLTQLDEDKFRKKNDVNDANDINIDDLNLINELNYSFVDENRKTNEKNLDINISIRGFNNANLNNIFSSQLHEMDIQTQLLPAPYCLLIEYIYGSHVCERRESVRYLHSYFTDQNNDYNQDNNQTNAEIVRQILNENINKKSINEIIRMLNFSEIYNSPNTSTIHKNCSKKIIYYLSRYVIIYNPFNSVQKIYQGHKNKISCIAINSKNNLVASGEVTTHPLILIWNVNTFETINIIKTGHQQGILYLEFSCNDKYIISVGFGQIFSIQVFMVKYGITPCFINIGNFPIFCLKTFNTNDNKFITMGYRNITVWKIEGTLLKIKKQIQTEEIKSTEKEKEAKIFLCCDLMDYTLGNSIETDIIIGSNFGDISGICCNKYILLKSDAHEGAINCLKITSNFYLYNQKSNGFYQRQYNIITTGEDGFLKIWDQFYNLIRKIDILEIANKSLELPIKDMIGIQSMDLYMCDKGKINILLGTRCGDLIEMSINNPHDLISSLTNINRNIQNNENNVISNENTQSNKNQNLVDLPVPNLEIEPFLLYSFPYSYDLYIKYYRTNFAVHPTLPILAIISVDHTIRIYNFKTKENILNEDLKTSATCVSFSPNGELIAIGTMSGEVKLINFKFQSGIMKNKIKNKNNDDITKNEINLNDILQVIRESSPNANNYSTFKTPATYPVLLTKFSSHGDFLAISYDNKRARDGKPQGGNHISIYMKSSSKKIRVLEQRHSSTVYIKYKDIIIPDNQYQLANINKLESASTHIDFSSDDLFILITHQQLSFTKDISELNQNDDFNYNLNKNKNYFRNNNFIFIVWDLDKNQITVNQETLQSLNFPGFTSSSAIFCRNFSALYTKENPDKEKKKNMFETINPKFGNTEFIPQTEIIGMAENKYDYTNVSSIWQSHRTLASIAGGLYGNLFLFRSLSLNFNNETLVNYVPEKITLDEMGQSRPYAAHIGSIAKIESTNDEKFIFTNSSVDQCVIQWYLMEEDCMWDLDFYPLSKDIPDPFMDIINEGEYKSMQKSLWKDRISVSEVYNQPFDDNYANKVDLDLLRIYGRRAYDKRNNLKYDNDNRLIYSISSYIVYLTTNIFQNTVNDNKNNSTDSKEIKQEFFVPINNYHEEYQMEISTFCLSSDKREIAIGFNGLTAMISRWEITTNLNLSKVVLNFCCIINILKFSYNNKKIIGYGLHKDYYGFVFIIDNILNKLISFTTLIHTLPSKIKDMDFVSGQTDQFYTCGIQHLSLWNLHGDNLEYRNIPLNKIKVYEQGDENKLEQENLIAESNKYGCYALVDSNVKIDTLTEMYYKKDPKIYIKCTFLNITTFKTFSILSADDGCLYILDKVDFISKNKYHDSPILALEKNEEQKFLLSGSLDGLVLLFKVDLNTRTLKMYSYFNLSESIVGLNSNIKMASINYNIQSIALGINKIGIGTKSGDIYEFQITDDIQIIKNEEKKKMLCKINFQDNEPPISVAMDINSNKLFTITEKGLLNVININNLKLLYSDNFKIRANHIYHFKYKKQLLIAFFNSIIVLDTSNDLYKQLSRYDLNFERTDEINEIKISPDEKILSVAALQDNSNPVLKIFDIINGFHSKKEVTDLNSRIKYLDFSRESSYILIENYLGEVLVIDIENGKKLTNKGYFDLEWMGNGLKFSSSFSCIQSIYKQNLDECIIVRNENYVAVGDNLGCLRLFKYPSDEADKCILCQTDHIDKIDNIFFSFDDKYLVTSSKADGSIFIYLFKDKVKREANEDEIIEEDSDSESKDKNSKNISKDQEDKDKNKNKNKDKKKTKISFVNVSKDSNAKKSSSKKEGSKSEVEESNTENNDSSDIKKNKSKSIIKNNKKSKKEKDEENEEKEDETEEENESGKEEDEKEEKEEEEEKEENEKEEEEEEDDEKEEDINNKNSSSHLAKNISSDGKKESSKNDSKSKSKSRISIINTDIKKIKPSSSQSHSSSSNLPSSQIKNEEESEDED